MRINPFSKEKFFTDIKRDIKYALHDLGFDKPRKHQVSPIRSLTGGQDTMMQETDLTLIVVDECRCITEWGYTFRDAYLCIGDFIQNLPHKPAGGRCEKASSAGCFLREIKRKSIENGYCVLSSRRKSRGLIPVTFLKIREK